MHQRISYFPFLSIFLSIFILISVPESRVEKIREAGLKVVIPSFNFARNFRSFILKVPLSPSTFEENQKKTQKLELENQLLKQQLDAVFEWLMYDQKIEEQVQRIKQYSDEEVKDSQWRSFFERRASELKRNLELNLQAVPANVVYRDPSSWSSSIWINLGRRTNKKMKREVISKNSPVVLGSSLVGVVEYVGEKRSRVRMITDSGLTPAVRALRGSSQDYAIQELVQSLYDRLDPRKDIFQSDKEKMQLLSALQTLSHRMSQSGKNLYLAKGEIHGSNQPLWRSRQQTLKGIGFNYAYSDEEGPSRSLFQYARNLSTPSDIVPILHVGDLLVTTGFDGVFPPGLQVAQISKIGDLQEGCYSYSLEAKPTAGDLHDLQVVFVLPAQPSEEDELEKRDL